MPPELPTLHLLCGKIASGKSTLGAELASHEGTILICEDDWLEALFSNEMSSISDYMRCAVKLRGIMAPHIACLLNAGVTVVLDFQANTVEARSWMRGILDQANARHRLHFLDVPDEVCLERLRARNAEGDHPFAVTEAEFRKISDYFVVPSPGEGFDVVVHDERSNRQAALVAPRITTLPS
jgi:predicted kinase